MTRSSVRENMRFTVHGQRSSAGIGKVAGSIPAVATLLFFSREITLLGHIEYQNFRHSVVKENNLIDNSNKRIHQLC